MTYEVYQYIFYGGMGVAVLFFIVSVLLFFVLRIPDVIGDLTGATARRAIEDIRNRNEETGEKLYKSSTVNKQRGRLTDKISESGRIISRNPNEFGGAMATEKISTQKIANNETTVLSSSNETTLLSTENETTLLSQAMNGVNEVGYTTQ